jgi:hypothetical protein
VYVVAIGVTDDGYETELGPMLVSEAPESLGESLKKLFKPSDTQEIRDPHKRETATKPRWAQVKDIVIRLQRIEQEDLVLVRESLINSLREGKENISIERG